MNDRAPPQHTSGPWMVEPINGGQTYQITDIRSRHFLVIAETPVDGTGQDEANARLIAAAPELLGALEKACVLLDRIRETCHYENGWPVSFLEARDIEIIHGDAVTELPAIRAAIQKARAA